MYDRAIRDDLSGRHHGAGGNEAVASDADAVENHRAVRDERRLTDRASVQQRTMADRDVGGQFHRLAGVRVDDGAVLDIGAVADRDPIIVAAQHTIEPYARPDPEANVADHASAGRNVVFMGRRLQPFLAERINHASLLR
ncbi:MAG: hypothetical protein ABSH33_18435 [Steroidobacteraceae bacterium]